jgi:hypothetical protein
MRKQRGVSLLGLLVIGFMVGFAMLLGFKLVPAYVEYFAVKKTIAVLAKEQKTGSPEDIRKAFEKRAVIEDINSFKADDLDIAKDKNGISISVAYDKTVPVFSNIYVLIKFEASSGGNGASGSSEESK